MLYADTSTSYRTPQLHVLITSAISISLRPNAARETSGESRLISTQLVANRADQLTGNFEDHCAERDERRG